MSQQFVDREAELEFLEKRYNSPNPEFIVLYGRRRVGKTELLIKFLEKKPGIYFLASKEGDVENIKLFTRELEKLLGNKTFSGATFSDWFSVFSSFVSNTKFNEIQKEEKVVIAIDEFPYLIESNKAIPSIFQRIWDLLLKNKNVMLILTGSAVSVMESEVIGTKSPLYGRRTAQWHLQPFSIESLNAFFPKYSFEDILNVWFVLGGIPAYLKKFDPDKSFFANIEENVLEKGSYLYSEAEVILNEEFREPKNYKLIFKALSLGYARHGLISNYTGLDRSMVSKYLDVLTRLRFVREEIPITASRRFKGRLYFIEDPYFNFWFRYIYPNRIDLEAMRYREILKKIKDDFPVYAGKMFERLAETLVREKKIFSNFAFTKIGRWWHKDKEIDLVALNEKSRQILFAECKWQSKVNAEKMVKELAEKANYVEWNLGKRKEYYAIFARSFSKRIEEFEGRPVYCVGLRELERGVRKRGKAER